MESFDLAKRQTDLFGGIPVSQVQSDNILVSDLNLAGGLPYGYNTADGETYETKVHSYVKSNGEFLETRIKGKRVNSIQNDILIIWQTMYKEQRDLGLNQPSDSDKILIYYSISYLTERLQLKDGSRGRVADAIKEMQDLKYEVTNFGYIEEGEQEGKTLAFKKRTINLISSHGEVKGINSINGKVSTKGSFFVELDASILANIAAGVIAETDPQDYLKLKSGPQRRLLPILNAKRKLFGDKFTIKLTEVAIVLGIDNPKKYQERVKLTFEKLKKTLKNVEFQIQKRRGEMEWDIYVEFIEPENPLNYTSPDEEFFHALTLYYGESKLESLDLKERDVQIIRGQIEKRVDKSKLDYDFYGERCNLAYFLIDVALFQVLETKYLLTSKLSTLVYSFLNYLNSDNFGIPSGYRHFVFKRIEEQRKQKVLKEIEVARREEELAEAKRKDAMGKSFEKAFEMMKKNPDIMSSLRKKAILKIKEVDPDFDIMDEFVGNLYKQKIEQVVEEIAREDFISGAIMDNLSIN